jgi:hypothetical protein
MINIKGIKVFDLLAMNHEFRSGTAAENTELRTV